MVSSDPLTRVGPRTATPQTAQADPRQVQNNAGGFTFQTSSDVRIHRFLTLGTTGGTFYVGQDQLTEQATGPVLTAARERAGWLVEQVLAVSLAGRAPRQQYAIFALAAAAGLGDDDGRKAALAALPQVCRTGTTLFQFLTYAGQFRGWGRALRRAVASWYTDRTADDLAYQVIKYRQRDGWTHRDVLRKAHPRWRAAVDTHRGDDGPLPIDDLAQRDLLHWIARRPATEDGLDQHLPVLVTAFEQALHPNAKLNDWVRLVGDHRLPWEALPDAARTHKEVWQALVQAGMPQHALLRQLPTLTRHGALDDHDLRAQVCAQLVDPERLRRSRIHPVQVLIAMRTYASGRSVQGTSTWTPDRRVIDALDAAFYASFTTREPTGKRTLLALDVSGSMVTSAGGLPLSCREASAAFALATMAVEPTCDVVGFTSDHGTAAKLAARTGRYNISVHELETLLTELSLSPRQRLDDAVRSISNMQFGRTDCSLPARWATSTGRDYDTIVIYTDNETWAGPVHPFQALNDYRRKVGHPVRQVVVGMTATDVTIADPSDPHSLDVAGLDAAVPNLIADFSRGEL